MEEKDDKEEEADEMVIVELERDDTEADIFVSKNKAKSLHSINSSNQGTSWCIVSAKIMQTAPITLGHQSAILHVHSMYTAHLGTGGFGC